MWDQIQSWLYIFSTLGWTLVFTAKSKRFFGGYCVKDHPLTFKFGGKCIMLGHFFRFKISLHTSWKLYIFKEISTMENLHVSEIGIISFKRLNYCMNFARGHSSVLNWTITVEDMTKLATNIHVLNRKLHLMMTLQDGHFLTLHIFFWNFSS